MRFIPLVAFVAFPAQAYALCESVTPSRAPATCGTACVVVVEHTPPDGAVHFERGVALEIVEAEVLRTTEAVLPPPGALVQSSGGVVVRARGALSPGQWNLMWNDQPANAIPIMVMEPGEPAPQFDIIALRANYPCTDELGCGAPWGGETPPSAGMVATLSLDNADSGAAFTDLAFDMWVLPAGAPDPVVGDDGFSDPPPNVEHGMLFGGRASTADVPGQMELHAGDTVKVVVRVLQPDGQASALVSKEYTIPDYSKPNCQQGVPGGALWLLLVCLWPRRTRAATR